jgi:hypothetical protein
MVENMRRYSRYLFAFVAFSISTAATASDLLLIGANFEELRKAHGEPVASESRDSTLVFRTYIDGVQYSLVYRLENGVATDALCIFPAERRRFLDSLPTFFGLLGRLLNGRSATETNIRLNGVNLYDQKRYFGLELPNNYIRITGDWSPGFYFSARLDSDDNRAVKSAMVSSFGFSIHREVSPP